jgi:hypothetical protein
MEQAKHHEPKFSESFYDLAKYISDLRVRFQIITNYRFLNFEFFCYYFAKNFQKFKLSIN